MAIEAGYEQFVEIGTQEKRVLSVLETLKALDSFSGSQVNNFQRIVVDGRYKQAFLR
jgi:hypothetical protein